VILTPCRFWLRWRFTDILSGPLSTRLSSLILNCLRLCLQVFRFLSFFLFVRLFPGNDTQPAPRALFSSPFSSQECPCFEGFSLGLHHWWQPGISFCHFRRTLRVFTGPKFALLFFFFLVPHQLPDFNLGRLGNCGNSSLWRQHCKQYYNGVVSLVFFCLVP